MYKIKFYKDKNGKEPVREYLSKLGNKKDKDSRINFVKIRDYVKALSLYGKSLGEPYIKHLDGDIWELRPMRNRILFFGFDGKEFVLLSHFVKKLKKPQNAKLTRQKG